MIKRASIPRWCLCLMAAVWLQCSGGANNGSPDAAVVDLSANPDLREPALSGRVTSAGNPVERARVTVVAGNFFAEVRTDASGRYAVGALADGSYAVGAAALRLEYKQAEVQIAGAPARQDFDLGPETNAGTWDVIGNTDPETFGGTNSGVLMTNGRIIYCHDTIDPVVFDPVTLKKTLPQQPQSLRNTPDSEQGCHQVTYLDDGRVLYVGGGTIDDAGNFTSGEKAIAVVKAFTPKTETWEVFPPLLEPRWYGGLARFADGRLLNFSGGQQPVKGRTNTAEVYDPVARKSTATSPFVNTDFSPTALLYTGEILVTWFPPTLYNPATGKWRATGNFVQTPRNYPDHADHTLLMMPDGRPIAIGTFNTGGKPPTSMVEVYDPATEKWSLRASPATLRMRPEVLQLPDKRIFLAGGQVVGGAPAMMNQWGYTNLVDLYDPEKDTWRAMTPMTYAREYHAITLLVPDGRVVVTAGVGAPGNNPPQNLTKEIVAFSPPYLFRGPRPRIESISSVDLTPGGAVTLRVSNTAAVTAVRLYGMNAITHFVDGGVPRLLELSFTQKDDQVTASLPADRNRLMSGPYLLFVMVDDVPSEGRIVRVPIP